MQHNYALPSKTFQPICCTDFVGVHDFVWIMVIRCLFHGVGDHAIPNISIPGCRNEGKNHSFLKSIFSNLAFSRNGPKTDVLPQAPRVRRHLWLLSRQVKLYWHRHNHGWSEFEPINVECPTDWATKPPSLYTEIKDAAFSVSVNEIKTVYVFLPHPAPSVIRLTCCGYGHDLLICHVITLFRYSPHLVMIVDITK